MNPMKQWLKKSFLCLATGFACLSQVVFHPGGTANTSSKAGGSRLTRSLAAPLSSTPDPLRLLNGRPPLPKGLKGEPTILDETVAVGGGLTQVSPTVVQQEVDINRVVSYQSVAGKITSSIITSGVVSPSARLTVFIKVVPSDINDKRKIVKLKFDKLNDYWLDGVEIFYQIGVDNFKRSNQVLIPTTELLFGQAKVDPLIHNANTDIEKNPENFKPTPGKNQLSFSSYSNLDGISPLIGSYTAHVYSFLEFDAVAPIILVHGTNADHTSWNEPVDERINGILFDPFVRTDNQGYFSSAPSAFRYMGVWYHNLDLDHHGSFNPWSGGNNDIDSSGIELGAHITNILNALGSKKCHIVAHSKGGSDARYFINNYPGIIPTSEKNPGKLANKYMVLSLYSMGTPHKGTPVADLSYNVGSHLQYMGIFSANADVQALIGSVNLGLILHAGPTRGALFDQRTDARIRQFNEDRTWDITGGHFYSVVGDADLNRNNVIDGDESKVVFPIILGVKLLSDADATYIYRLNGLAKHVDAEVVTSPPHPQTGIQYEFIRLTVDSLGNSSTPEPNDLVTPFWSGLGPKAKPFQVTNQFFTVKSGYSTLYSGAEYEFSRALTPGNHSILKSEDAARQIMGQILLDYPLKSLQGGL